MREAICVRADGFGVMAYIPSLANRVMRLVAAELEALGFGVKVAGVGTLSRFIGYLPVSSLAGFRRCETGLRALDAALALLSRPGLRFHAGEWALLDIAVGKCMAAALLWRPAMSVMHAVYSQLQRPRLGAPLWEYA